MKVTINEPQLPRTRKKLARRNVKSPTFAVFGSRVRRSIATPVENRSGAGTLLLECKAGHDEQEELSPQNAAHGRRTKRGTVAVSARKLGAVLWQMQLPDVASGCGGSGLGFQPVADHAGVQFLYHNSRKADGSEAESPESVKSTKDGFSCKLHSSVKFSSSVMEGATKWDSICRKPLDEVHHNYGYVKCVDQRANSLLTVSTLEAQLEQAQSCIHELEIECQSSKKKLDHFLRKVSEERAGWRTREHEKIRIFIDDLRANLNREKKNCQRLESVNSKLVNELADSKRTARKFMQGYEKERKSRMLIEEVCDELAKEIGEDKAEVDFLKVESMKVHKEAEDERKMLQLAEVWREERVQMKLVDAKLALEEKYSQMSNLVAQLEAFLKSRNAAPDVKELGEAKFLQESAGSVNIQGIKEFVYEPPTPDGIFPMLEDVRFGESKEREIEPCSDYSHAGASDASGIRTVSSDNMVKDNIAQHSNGFSDSDGDIEEEESGWETVSHPEEDSSYSLIETTSPAAKNRQHMNGYTSGTEWEENVSRETPHTEVSEVYAVLTRQLKKPSITRLWRSFSSKGDNYKPISVEGGRVSNGRMSNASMLSLDQLCSKGVAGSPDVTGQYSSSESDYSHEAQVRKGCIEWPRSMQKKVQSRHVLKHKT